MMGLGHCRNYKFVCKNSLILSTFLLNNSHYFTYLHKGKNLDY